MMLQVRCESAQSLKIDDLFPDLLVPVFVNLRCVIVVCFHESQEMTEDCPPLA